MEGIKAIKRVTSQFTLATVLGLDRKSIAIRVYINWYFLGGLCIVMKI